MDSTNRVIFPESMVDILANPIDIFFGSMPAKSITPAACLVIEGNAVTVDQQPVYYISEVLADAKTHYTQPQKLLYVLLITSRKLRHYFQAHKIVVPSLFPLGEIIRNRDANGRIIKWSVELGEFEIEFYPRQAIKS
jgi:hypothetical protein